MSTDKINPICMEMGKINFAGNVNVIHDNWYQHVKTDSGKTDAVALLILSDIVYWYTPTEIRSESTGKTIGYRQKFKADKLQRSYKDFENQFGFSHIQIKRATDRLVAQNLITKEFRTVEYGTLRMNNVLFMEPVSATIEYITNNIAPDPSLLKSKQVSTEKSIGDSEKVNISTETTPEITPEQSKDCSTASEERCREKDGNFINQENNLESQRSSAKQKPIKKKSLDSNQSNAATLRNNTPRKTKKLVKPDYMCPKTIQPYIDVWSTITGRRYRGKNTNTYKQDCQAIKRMVSGTFFNPKDTPTVDKKYDGEKLTLDEWRETLESFSLMRNNADYFPKNKKNIKTLTIKSFLYNAMSPCTMKSYFITCIESAPKLLSPQLKDSNPDYTDYVIQACKKVFDWDLGNGDRATAIKCANKLSKFFVDNKHRISMYDIHYKFTNQQVDELLTMLEKNESPEYPAKPTYLYGSLTYDKLLPEHLDRVGSLLQ